MINFNRNLLFEPLSPSLSLPPVLSAHISLGYVLLFMLVECEILFKNWMAGVTSWQIAYKTPWDIQNSFLPAKLSLFMSRNRHSYTPIAESQELLESLVFLFLFQLIFNWRIITSQCCAGVCHTTTWINCKYMYVSPLLNLPPTTPPPYPSCF